LHRSRGANANRLTVQTSLTKKLPVFQNADDGFLALLGHNGHLDVARLNVKNSIGFVTLGVNDPVFTILLYRFSGPDPG
jgi:hypothetical protein